MLQNFTRTQGFKSAASVTAVAVLATSLNMGSTAPVSAQDRFADRGDTQVMFKLRHLFGVKPGDQGSTNMSFGVNHTTVDGAIIGAGLGFNLQDARQGTKTDTYLVNEVINGYEVTREVRQTSSALDRITFGLTAGHDGGVNVSNDLFSGPATVTMSFSKASLENPLVAGFSFDANIGNAISLNLFDGGNAVKLDPSFKLQGVNANNGGTTTPVVQPVKLPQTANTGSQPSQPTVPTTQGTNPTAIPTNVNNTTTGGTNIGVNNPGGTTNCAVSCNTHTPTGPDPEDTNYVGYIIGGLAALCAAGTGARYAADKVLRLCGIGGDKAVAEPTKPVAEARTNLQRLAVKGETIIYIGDPQEGREFSRGPSGGLLDQWHVALDMQDGTNHGQTLHPETVEQLRSAYRSYAANKGGAPVLAQN